MTTRYATFTSEELADRELDLDTKPPEGHAGPVPPGIGAAAWLREAVAATGTAKAPNRWVTYDAHGFELDFAGQRNDVVLKLTDRDAGTFELSVEPRRGLMPWKRKNDPPGARAAAKAVHDALRRDSRVQALQWYDDEAWGRRGDVEGAAEPPGVES